MQHNHSGYAEFIITALVVGMLFNVSGRAYAATDNAKFNLRCTGKKWSSVDKKEEPFEAVFVVDLANKRFMNPNGSISNIQHVDDNKITVVNYKYPEGGHVNENIDRNTGEYFWMLEGRSGNVMGIQGKCEKHKFTGFPNKKF